MRDMRQKYSYYIVSNREIIEITVVIIIIIIIIIITIKIMSHTKKKTR